MVPGFYGTNSVKWLTSITLADSRAPGPFTSRWYQDPDGTPIWSIAPESLIVAPYADQTVGRTIEQQIWGWAWADGGVSAVSVRIGENVWQKADLELPRGRQWRRFRMRWIPQQTGTVELAARAASASGLAQPMSDARNAIHTVQVHVR